MKTRITALCTVLLLFALFAAPVYASESDVESDVETAVEYHHVLDSEGLLSEEKKQEIEEAAKAVLENNGVDLFAYVTAKEMADPKETGSSIYQNHSSTDASVVMMVDKKNAYIRTYGRAEAIFTSDEIKSILKQAKKQEKRPAKLLKFISLTGKSLTEKGVLPIPEGRLLPRLVDDAGLLAQDDKYTLVRKLDNLSDKWQLDVVVVTNNSLGDKSVEAYADDFYDYNGYGYGENDDGILLLLSMETREWAISTYGKAIDIFTDSEQQYISDGFLPYLSDGDYFGGFMRFAELCDSSVEAYNETGYTEHNGGSKAPFGWLSAIGGSLIIGLIAGFATAMTLRSQLTSVKPQAMATAYAKKGSLNITERNDLFLYHNITRVAKPKDNDSGSSRRSHSGGHSSTHTSSSGRSHGGSHGHF